MDRIHLHLPLAHRQRRRQKRAAFWRGDAATTECRSRARRVLGRFVDLVRIQGGDKAAYGLEETAKMEIKKGMIVSAKF